MVELSDGGLLILTYDIFRRDELVAIPKTRMLDRAAGRLRRPRPGPVVQPSG